MFGISMSKRSTMIAFGFVAIAVTISVFAFNSMSASAASSVGHDPIGDAISESGSSAPGFLDVKNVRITEKKGRGEIEFACNLAAPAPAALGADDFAALCALSLNVNPTTGASEYVVAVRWNNGAYEGVLIDYTAGFPPSETPIDYAINGSNIKATVPAAAIGDPDSLTWVSLSREKQFVPTNPLEGVTDIAPDGIATLPWSPGDELHFENLGTWSSK
jgi:hypothetical protein